MPPVTEKQVRELFGKIEGGDWPGFFENVAGTCGDFPRSLHLADSACCSLAIREAVAFTRFYLRCAARMLICLLSADDVNWTVTNPRLKTQPLSGVYTASFAEPSPPF
jgi:hypothetical protein